MSEYPIAIANLNDFVFCPASIYFHSMDSESEDLLYKDTYQINGTSAHEKSDTRHYSTRKSMLQAIEVYSTRYNVVGKIDTFDADNGILTERKKRIKTIYDGYVYQLYAQYYSLKEMGYAVEEIRLYSMDDNKIYKIVLPEEDELMSKKFENIISEMSDFNINDFHQNNISKCEKCIYESLCSYSALKEVGNVDGS